MDTDTAGKKVRFELPAKPGSEVFVAGTFNNWSPTANPLKYNPALGHFETFLHVPDGKHEYKFVVNGVWSVDPKCTAKLPNAYGSHNSVLHVSCQENDQSGSGGSAEVQDTGLSCPRFWLFRKRRGRNLKNNLLGKLYAFGQSVWMDHIREDMLVSIIIGLSVLIMLMLILCGKF